MIINPIIPVLIMAIICIALAILVMYNKQDKKIKINKKISIKLAIIVLLFIMNLRFMIPNGETMAMNSDLNVLFVIDTSVSMRALDYENGKERLEGVKKDCSHIIDELSGSKFSLITFGDTARRVMPFTTDSDMVMAEINALSLENDFYAKGSSMNLAKDILEKTLKEEEKVIVFFITDGEITKENETLESFGEIAKYISDGAVLGYGTKQGGKMVSSTYADEPNSEYYYLYYYDDDYNMKTALSMLDENNLNKMSQDLGIEYIHMDKQSNINNKLKDIVKQMEASENSEEKITNYQDTYFYFAIPLVILLIIDFVIKKRKM